MQRYYFLTNIKCFCHIFCELHKENAVNYTTRLCTKAKWVYLKTALNFIWQTFNLSSE